MKLNFAEEVQVIPLLPPQTIAATATGSDYVKMASIGSGQLEIEIYFGLCSHSDATGDVTVTVETSTGGISTDTNTAIAFHYRLSAATGTDTLAAITAATSAGYTALHSVLDYKLLLIYVDPAVAQAEYVRAYIAPYAGATVTNLSVIARFTPRYAQNVQIPSVSS